MRLLFLAFILSCTRTIASGLISTAPSIPQVTATCAQVEFQYRGDRDSLTNTYLPPSRLHIYARAIGKGIPPDAWVQWGAAGAITPVPNKNGFFRTLLRGLPPGTEFAVKLTADDDPVTQRFSPPSKAVKTLEEALNPPPSHTVKVHRTDPRLNKQRVHPTGAQSVCVDVHWHHPHLPSDFSNSPFDTFFTVSAKYRDEPPWAICEDYRAEDYTIKRNCGHPVYSSLQYYHPWRPASAYHTVCGLRDGHNITFEVATYNCDGPGPLTEMTAPLPPKAPDVVRRIHVRDRTIYLDWVPQHSPWISGYAIYLGLSGMDAMKLLCYVPLHEGGSVDLPLIPLDMKKTLVIQDRLPLGWDACNDTRTIKQQQEIGVSARLIYGSESPLSRAPLNGWIVDEDKLRMKQRKNRGEWRCWRHIPPPTPLNS
ncbi:unnamed protein product [Vitrella brassicaformis CCMP3155]|uniref:Fibronectin type-III domain-containing protein n=1 Tax=Vitrella brassicaformis (strain CCMP3155) TaxID=1169540 RepID=A0A0G4GIR9_VITBC|nr:unnamed protein product [Vitrella brassicaformis CCMP3155]|eukprot:CEM29595.1 unnamed protein product [Vitrella brassicaformis CCMP3155]